MGPFGCRGCEALRESLAAAERRETALLGEIRHLSDSLLALGDARAHLAVNGPKAPPAQEQRRSLQLPAWAAGLAGHHVNLREARKRHEDHVDKSGLPPLAKDA